MQTRANSDRGVRCTHRHTDAVLAAILIAAAAAACSPDASKSVETSRTSVSDNRPINETEAGENAHAGRPAAAMLTMEHARSRVERVSNVAYDLKISLSGDLPEYSGTVTAHFELAGSYQDLTMDFAGGTVHSLIVNGSAADGSYNKFYITLSADALQVGTNTVTISYSRPYSSDGVGLYRFRDPEDGRYYLYSDFEPYDQNRLFPSFDQPDLKARFATEVTAPADWQVITNVRETATTENAGQKIWTFPTTPPISTYVYALHAGQYHVWDSRAGGIPLRLFARESLVPYVYPEHWFVPTQQGFEFFQRYFEIPYPFDKYDQIIVPHFNAGAMEGVGAVTFNEGYLRRGTVTRQNRRSITRVVLHEMAHMWLGNLVTMDWWNGLWLNESFATVMAVIAMVEATEFADQSLHAFRNTVRAYEADERDTTHPIEMSIPDTDDGFASFDRITYQKGSATLMQLNHLVGPETFRRGVSNYLKEHAYGNTGIRDFLNAISEAADLDLEEWARVWLLEPGTNTMEVEFSCEAGTIETMTIVQGAPVEWPALRRHRTQLGLYYFENGDVAISAVPTTYSGERSDVLDAVGEPCPDMVYANHGDWDYVRVRLAPDALPLLYEYLSAFSDPLTRLMLWQSTWDLALDGRITLTDYVEFALRNLDKEPEEAASQQVLAAIRDALEYLGQIETNPVRLADIQKRVETYLWERIGLSEPHSDRQLLFFDHYVRAVTSVDGVQRLAELLTGEESAPTGITIDQDRRWSILQVLGAWAHADFTELLAAEGLRDPSDHGRRRALAAEAGQPDPELKKHWIAALLDPSATSKLAEFRAIANGLFPTGQHMLQLNNSETVLASLPRLNATRNATFFSSYVGSLLGPICSTEFHDRLDERIADSDSLHAIIVRRLKDSRFEVNRCLRIAAAQEARS